MTNKEKREVLEILVSSPQTEERDELIKALKQELDFVDIPHTCIDSEDFIKSENGVEFVPNYNEKQLELIAEEISNMEFDWHELFREAEECAKENHPEEFENVEYSKFNIE